MDHAPSAHHSTIEERLRDLGLRLPDLAPTHEFLATVTSGEVTYISGHAPFQDGEFRYRGRVGQEFDIETGRKAAELAMLGCLASLKVALGTLDKVKRILKMNGYVNSTPDFTALPRITDAASSLLIALFGEAGRHARTTVGVASLPAGVAVEIEMVVQIRV